MGVFYQHQNTPLSESKLTMGGVVSAKYGSTKTASWTLLASQMPLPIVAMFCSTSNLFNGFGRWKVDPYLAKCIVNIPCNSVSDIIRPAGWLANGVAEDFKTYNFHHSWYHHCHLSWHDLDDQHYNDRQVNQSYCMWIFPSPRGRLRGDH